MNILPRAGWALVVRRPELSYETWEMKVKEVIFLDPSVMVTDLETIVAKFKKEEDGVIDLEFQLLPLVIATSEEISQYLNKLVSDYTEMNPIHAEEFSVTAGEIIPL